MATYCFILAAILAVSVMHSSSRVISRDQQAKIAGKRDESGTSLYPYSLVEVHQGTSTGPRQPARLIRVSVKGSFPLIARNELPASAFKYCDWINVLAASLRVVFCDEWI